MDGFIPVLFLVVIIVLIIELSHYSGGKRL
jgi:hypothetical protein